MAYSDYTLVPGTNQLIYTNAQNAGTALFKKHGYNIQHPRHRDYYNALRRREGGMDFFSDLGSVITGIFGQGGAFAKGGAFASGGSNVSRPGAALTASSAGLTPTPTSGLFSPDIFGGSPSYANVGFDGEESGYTSSDPRHLRAYNELVEHLRRESLREAQIPYVQYVYTSNGYPQALPAAQQDGLQQDTRDDRQTQDTIFGIPTQIAYGLGLLIAVWVYFKYIKK